MTDGPRSFLELFQRDCPYYMSIGMTYDQYWYGDVRMTEVFRNAHKIRMEEQNQMLWLQGQYVYNAICSVAPVLVTMPKKGAEILPYPDFLPLFQDGETKRAQEEKEEKERLQAKLYMQQMMRAGKNWGGS